MKNPAEGEGTFFFYNGASSSIIINPDEERRRMEKVPVIIRQVEHNKHEYDPKVVSFGPYHHGNKDLELVEQFKEKAMEIFVSETDGKDTQFFHKEVLKIIKDAKGSYLEGSTDAYSDEQFARMMILDACLIIMIVEIDTNYHMNLNKKIQAMVKHLGRSVMDVIRRDLFLIENQIPYRVLNLLICLKHSGEEGKQLLDKFMHKTLGRSRYKKEEESDGSKQQQQLSIELNQSEPLHLLEAFRDILINEGIEEQQVMYSKCWGIKGIEPDEAQSEECLYSFRSVMELKAKGIHFRPIRSPFLTSIDFKSGYIYARLELPVWHVSAHTKTFLLNMVAYEMCAGNVTDMEVSSYVNFMKSLIESPDDVKELREQRILFNTLGTDEEVARVFTQIDTYGGNNFFLFRNIMNKVQKHYDSKTKTWMAELIYTYFRTPWTFIAFLAATAVLGLTITQTYYAINPA